MINSININENNKIYKLSKNNNLYYSNLNNNDCYDIVTFSFKGNNSSKMLKYYQYTNTKYNITNDLEKTFLETLNDFSTITDITKEDVVKNKSSKFMNAYSDLMTFICNNADNNKTDESMLKNVFCSMIEAFDISKSIKFSETLNYCIFEDFIPFFESNNTIKNIIETYTNSDILNRNIFKIRLAKILKQ